MVFDSIKPYKAIFKRPPNNKIINIHLGREENF